MRAFALSFLLWAIAIAAASCGAPDAGLPPGLVAAPMLAAGVRPAGPVADAGADAGLRWRGDAGAGLGRRTFW